VFSSQPGGRRKISALAAQDLDTVIETGLPSAGVVCHCESAA
jgi:hypothetical protein